MKQMEKPLQDIKMNENSFTIPIMRRPPLQSETRCFDAFRNFQPLPSTLFKTFPFNFMNEKRGKLSHWKRAESLTTSTWQ